MKNFMRMLPLLGLHVKNWEGIWMFLINISLKGKVGSIPLELEATPYKKIAMAKSGLLTGELLRGSQMVRLSSAIQSQGMRGIPMGPSSQGGGDGKMTLVEWMPIETAQKNGKEVLVYGGGSYAVASFDGDEWGDMGDIGWGGMYGDDNQPTRWMPLPTPPSKTEIIPKSQ